MLSGGVLLVAAGWLLGHYWLGLAFETALTLIGSIILIVGHWLNYKHHRTCKNTRHNHHPITEN